MDLDRVVSRINPGVAWILRSPLHALLSRGLLLITVTGRRSGRRYTIPVGYQRAGDTITVLVAKAPRKRWWRNYRIPGSVELRVRGERLRGEARVVAGDTLEFREAVEATFRRLPWLGRQFGVDYQPGRGLGEEQWRQLAGEAALVKIALARDG